MRRSAGSIAILAVLAVLTVLVLWSLRPDRERNQPRRGAARSARTHRSPAPGPARDATPLEPASTAPPGVSGVVSGPDGEALPRAIVRLNELWPSGEIRRWHRAHTTADETGRFAAKLPPGHYSVVAIHGHAHSARHVIDLKRSATVDLVVKPGPAELRIVLEPQHGGVDLSVFSLQPYTSSSRTPATNGSWTLRGLHVGDLLGFGIEFKPDDFAWSNNPRIQPSQGGSRQVYEVRITQLRQQFVVKVDRFAWIKGRLVGPDGKPGHANVEVVSGGRFRSRDWVSGEFMLRALPGRPVSVFASGSQGLGTRAPKEIAPLKGGEVSEVALEIEPFRGSATIGVVGPDDSPIAGLEIQAAVRIGPHHGSYRATTDAQGRAVWTRLPAGTGELRVTLDKESPYARPLPIPVDMNGQRQADAGIVRLTRGGSIQGTAHRGEDPHHGNVHAVPLDARGEPIWLWRREARTDERGTFRIDRLAAGRYRVVTSFAKHAHVALADVVDGAITRAALLDPR